MNLQTIVTTLSSVNQTAVPSIVRKYLSVLPGDKLIWQIEAENKTVKITPAPSKWGQYMRGLGKKVWEGVEAVKYVNDLRQDRG
jgi:bifunctional DNA-binding transcriptional regulator/antitoxin component of YhaV-PrlF toxin-antitoxin module